QKTNTASLWTRSPTHRSQYSLGVLAKAINLPSWQKQNSLFWIGRTSVQLASNRLHKPAFTVSCALFARSLLKHENSCFENFMCQPKTDTDSLPHVDDETRF